MSKNKPLFSVEIVRPEEGKNLKESRLFKDFESFWARNYDIAFPDPDEREDMKDIVARMLGEQEPATYALIGYDQIGKPVAGMIADWYDDCKSLENIYIATDCDHRWQPNLKNPHYGRRMLTEGIARLRQKDALPDMMHVYLEVENPLVTEESAFPSPINPVDRLCFFHSCGARRIMIDYIQPPLGPDKDWCYSLFLLSYPLNEEQGKDEFAIHDKDLMAFLAVFYACLLKKFEKLGKDIYKSKAEEFHTNLGLLQDQIRTVENINNDVPLDPLMDEPHFLIPEISMITHYNLGDIDLYGKKEKPKEGDDGRPHFIFEPDPTYNSYECDLFKYVFQNPDDRPFWTRHLELVDTYNDNVPKEDGTTKIVRHEVLLHLPAFYHFSSEGKKFYRINSRRKGIPVDISLSYSFRPAPVSFAKPPKEKESTMTPRCLTLASVCFAPAEGACFSDLDIIQLIVQLGFGSKQENVEPRNCCIDVSDDMGPRESLARFLSRHFKQEEALFSRPVGLGASEINLFGIQPLIGTKEGGALPMPDSFSSLDYDIANAKGVFLEWNKTLCGILLGIFDFKRMAEHEIVETIQPVFRWASAFLLLSRGHLTKIYYSDPKDEDDEEVRRENTLISPYLQIPSSALAFNENVLRINEERLAEREKDLNEKFSHPLKMRFYKQYLAETKGLAEIRSLLDKEYAVDVFQYPSETAILQSATLHRGYSAHQKKLNASIERAESRCDEFKDKYTGGINTIQNILLFALTGLQVTTAIADIETEEGLRLSTFMPSIVMVILVLLVGGFIYIDKRRM